MAYSVRGGVSLEVAVSTNYDLNGASWPWAIGDSASWTVVRDASPSVALVAVHADQATVVGRALRVVEGVRRAAAGVGHLVGRVVGHLVGRVVEAAHGPLVDAVVLLRVGHRSDDALLAVELAVRVADGILEPHRRGGRGGRLGLGRDRGLVGAPAADRQHRPEGDAEVAAHRPPPFRAELALFQIPPVGSRRKSTMYSTLSPYPNDGVWFVSSHIYS